MCKCLNKRLSTIFYPPPAPLLPPQHPSDTPLQFVVFATHTGTCSTQERDLSLSLALSFLSLANANWARSMAILNGLLIKPRQLALCLQHFYDTHTHTQRADSAAIIKIDVGYVHTHTHTRNTHTPCCTRCQLFKPLKQQRQRQQRHNPALKATLNRKENCNRFMHTLCTKLSIISLSQASNLSPGCQLALQSFK